LSLRRNGFGLIIDDVLQKLSAEMPKVLDEKLEAELVNASQPIAAAIGVFYETLAKAVG